MTEQEIREIVEGYGLETCVGGYDELVSALHQKFEQAITDAEEKGFMRGLDFDKEILK